MNLFLYAQECIPAGGTAQQGSSGGLASFIPIVVIFLIFYFLLILPQQKKMKEHQQMLEKLKKGDNVLLSNGIYGTITNIKADIVELKVAENVKINVLKTTVSQIISEEQMKSIVG